MPTLYKVYAISTSEKAKRENGKKRNNTKDADRILSERE